MVSLKGVNWKDFDSVKALAQEMVRKGAPAQIVIRRQHPDKGIIYNITFASTEKRSLDRSPGEVVWRSD